MPRRAGPFRFCCVAAMLAAGCVNRPAMLTQHMEAIRLASDLRVQFTKAADAANRAVIATTDEASASAAREAGQATQAVQRDVEALQPILESLAYRDVIQHLDVFKGRFTEYRALDSEILPLAIENTNLKAQRLAFGPAREAAKAFRDALETAARSASSQQTLRVEAIVQKATVALLDTMVLQAPHIAESDDAAMSRMEAQMTASDAQVREALDALKGLLPPAAGPRLRAATGALDTFKAINTELVTLSRRNTNVRSLALSIGRKRAVTALCDDQLRALEEAVAKHGFTATR